MPKGKNKQKHARHPFLVALTMEGTHATIDVSGVIGWSVTAATFTDKVDEAKAAGATDLLVRINSVGGYCHEGLAMGDCLQSCGMRTTGVVIGTAQSMASYLLQCCEVRQAHAHATLMFHQPYGCIEGTVDEMREQAAYLCSMRDAMFELMGKRCGMSGKDLSAEHMTAKYYTGEQALAKGFLDSLTGDSGEDKPAPEEPPAEDAPVARGVVYDSRAALMAAMLGEEEEESPEDDTEEEDHATAEGEEKEDPEDDTEEEDHATAEGEEEEGTEDETEEEAPTTAEGEEEEGDVGHKPSARGSAINASMSKPAMFTREQVTQMCQQAAQKAVAAAMASMGADPDTLPGQATGCAQQQAPTREQFAAADGLQKLEMMAHWPQLGMPH